MWVLREWFIVLNRFISKSRECSFPIFQSFNGPRNNFTRGHHNKKTSKNKEVFCHTTNINLENNLFMYILARDNAVSQILVQEQQKEQKNKY